MFDRANSNGDAVSGCSRGSHCLLRVPSVDGSTIEDVVPEGAITEKIMAFREGVMGYVWCEVGAKAFEWASEYVNWTS